jgi:hypothetical protein
MKLYMSAIIVSLVSVFTMSAYAEPAVVIEGDECAVGFFPNFPDPTGGDVFIGTKVHAVAATSGNNTYPNAPGKVNCSGQHDQQLDQAVLIREPCVVFGTPYGDIFTEQGMLVASPSGKWTAQCIFHIDPGPQN